MTHPEIVETITDLIERFGESAVQEAVSHLEIGKQAEESHLVLVRALAIVILDSDDPKLVATLVARLTGLDQAAGKSKSMAELAREFGRTKSFISWYQRIIAERLNLPNNNFTAKARESLSNSARVSYGSNILRSVPQIAAIASA